MPWARCRRTSCVIDTAGFSRRRWKGLYRVDAHAECLPHAPPALWQLHPPGRIAPLTMLLLIVSAIKLVVEIALMALAGQFLLGLLAGAKRERNFFYRVLQVMTQPVIKAVRFMTPRVVLDRHVPLAAFALLASIWLVTTIVKINICLQVGIDQCR